MTLWDALKTEWDATRSVPVTFGRSDGVRYTFGATSYFRTFYTPVARGNHLSIRNGVELRPRIKTPSLVHVQGILVCNWCSVC